MSGRRVKVEKINGTNVKTTLATMFRRMLVYVAGTVDVDENSIDTVPVADERFLDRCVSFARYDQLMKTFVSDARNSIGNNRKEASMARGNLQKELLKANMSWLVFTKGLRFLGVTSFQITIKLQHSNGKVSEHTEKVNIGKPQFINHQNDLGQTSGVVTSSVVGKKIDIVESTRNVDLAASIFSRNS